MQFAENCGLGPPSDLVSEDAPLPLAGATFRVSGDIVRAWYVSDGASFAKVTYTNAEGNPYESELRDCEEMVRTILFKYTEAGN
jgi:hypothetical protein